MIDTIDSKLNGATITTLPAYLNYSVTYAEGGNPIQNHLLAANSTETYKVILEYRTDIDANQLPPTNQTLNLQFTITYRQATEDAQEVEYIVYTTSRSYLNQPVNYYYNNSTEALEDVKQILHDDDLFFYLRHRLDNRIIIESYVEFVITQEMANAYSGLTTGTYYIRGLDTRLTIFSCKDEYYNSSTESCVSPYYENNKAILLHAFGNSNCTIESNYISCNIGGKSISANEDGDVTAGNENGSCYVSDTGMSKCGVNV